MTGGKICAGEMEVILVGLLVGLKRREKEESNMVFRFLPLRSRARDEEGESLLSLHVCRF